MIHSKHKLSYCSLCECDMVICATCGNNCCNAMYGDVDGIKCTDCPDAYEVQDAFWKDKTSVQFAEDVRPTDVFPGHFPLASS